MKSDRKAKADFNATKPKKQKVSRTAAKTNGHRKPAAKQPVTKLEEVLKQERRALVESRQRLLATYEHAPIGIVECSPEGQYLNVNEEFCRLTGYSRDELLGLNIRDLVHEADYEAESSQYQKLLEGRIPSYMMEKRYVCRDGSVVWVEITRSVVRDTEENPLYTVGSVLDISERKRSEQALKEYARQQTALYKLADEMHRTNSMPEVFDAALNAILSALQCDRASILLFDDAGVMRFVAWRGLSDRYRKATDGHSPWKPDAQEPQPISMGDIATADLDENLRAVIRKEGIGALAFIPLVANGKLIGKFMMYFNTPHVFDAGEEELALTIARQLAFGIDRQRAEEKLRESEERFRTLTDSAPVMVWVNGPDAGCEYVNKEYLDFFGKRLEDVQGFGWQPLLHPEDRDEYVSAYLSAFEDRRPFQGQTRLMNKAGEYRWAEVYGLPRYSPSGEFLGYIGICHDITENRRAQEILRDSEERFRSLISQATAGIARSDMEGRLNYSNPRFCEMLGYSESELVGRTIWELTYSEDLEENKRLFAALMARGEPYQFEKRFIRRDGSMLWASVSVSPTRDHEGRIIGGVGVVVDISERKNAEEKLRESEERYRAVVESQSEMLCRFRPDGTILFVNGAYARARGTTAEELINHNFWEFVAEADRDAVKAMLHSLTPEKPEIRIENRFETSEGERWTLWSNRALKFDSEGQLLEAQSSGIDITHRKRAEEAVRESEERFRNLSNAVPSIVWTAAPDGRITYVNEKWYQYTGLTPEENEIGWAERVVHPDDYDRIVREWTRALETITDEYVVEVRNRRYDGEYRWFQTRAVPARDGSGQVTGWYGITTDIHDRIESETALRESEERLRLATEAAQMYTWELDLKTGGYTVSDNVAAVLGFSEDLLPETIGQAIEQLSHPDDRELVGQALASAAEKGTNLRALQSRALHPITGEVIWLEGNGSVVIGKDGRPDRIVGVTQNITEGKRREEEVRRLNSELQAQLEEMNSLLEILPTGVLIGNHDCSEITGNPAAYDMLALMPGINVSFTSPNPELPAGVQLFINHEEILADDAPMQRVARSGKPLYNQEHELVVPGGAHKFIHANIVPLFDEFGAVRKVIATYTDFTARKQAEEALRAKEAELAEILNETPFMLTRCTRDFHYRFVSRAYAEMIGRTPADLKGKSILEVMGREGYSTLEPYMQQVLQGKRIEFEAPVAFAGAGRPWLHVIYSPDRNPEGEVVGWFASIVDVTHRKEAEDALRASAQRQQFLVELGDALRPLTDAIEVQAEATRVLGQYLGASRVFYAELEPDGEHTNIHRDYHSGVASFTGRFRAEDFGPALINELRAGRTLVVADAATEPSLTDKERATFRATEIGSAVGVPLIKGNRWVAALIIHQQQPRIWTPLEIALIEETAARTWDAVERARAESALRLSKERLQLALDASGMGTFVWYPDEDRAESDERMLALFGLTPQGKLSLADALATMIHPEDGPGYAEAVGRAIDPEGPGHLRADIRVFYPDGSMHWVAVTGQTSFEGEPRRAVRMNGIAYDISERKQAEDALRASEALYRAIARSIPGGGVYVLDKDLRYLVAEGPVTEAFGYTPESIEGHTVAEVLSGDLRVRFEDRIRRVFAGERLSSEVEHDGRVYWSQYAPLVDALGQAMVITMDITDRKRAEEAWRESKEKYQNLFDSVPVAVYTCDADGLIEEYNQRAVELWGREPRRNDPTEKYCGSFKIYYPDGRFMSHAKCPMSRVLHGETLEPHELEILVERPDGVVRNILAHPVAMRDEHGQIVAAINCLYDITERKQAEEALRVSEERLRAIINQATAGIVREEVDGTLVFVNEAFCNMIGYEESELIGRPIWELTHPQDVPENRRLYDRMIAEGTPFQLEKRLLRKDGSVIWVNVSVSPVLDASGKPQSVVAVEVDITRRKQAEEALQQLNLQLESRVQRRTAKLQAVNQALRESEATTRTILDTAPDAIVITDDAGRIVRVNAQIKNLFGYQPDEVIGKPFDMLIPERYQGWHQGSRGTDGTFTPPPAMGLGMDIFGRRRDSSEFPVDVKLTPITGVTDWDVMITMRDTTERKQMADALYSSRERLRLLSRRLVEVQEEERRTIARELHDRVGQTLAALNINLIILGSQISPESLQRIGTRLDDSVKLVAEAVALVRDVMTDLRPAVLDDYGLEAALQSHIDAYSGRYNIKVAFDHPGPQIPRLEPGMEMTLLRIAQEALTNVARHAEANDVRVSLALDEQAIHLAIEDNGVGIEPSANGGRPQSHGLKIMQERAEAYGGNVEVESTVGRGTKIRVRIPIEGHVQDEAQEKKAR